MTMSKRPLQFDVLIPNCREGMFAPAPYAGPEEIVQSAKLAEKQGYDAIWAADFLSRTPDHPSSDGGPPSWYEPLISLSYAAAVTSRIKLGTGVIMAPFREPVVLAKQDNPEEAKNLLRKALSGEPFTERQEAETELARLEGQ